MLRTLLFSYLCILFLAGQSAAIAQQNNNWNNQLGQSGWQTPQNTQSQPQQWQAPQSQGQWQSGGWQPINSSNQAGPSYYGTATSGQTNDQYQEPGAYLNQSNPNGAFNDSINGASTNLNNPATNSTPNQTQKGQVHKHEGLKNTLTGMGKALETAATVAAPVAGAAGAMMMTRAMMGPYAYSPYGFGGYPMGMGMPMMPYGGYNPYGGYGTPFMRPGMSSFFHY
jgi:hypothetical protein